MIDTPIVFMFSGQGSHYFQMGRALYEQHRLFRDHMDAMDAIARDLCGQSIVDTLYEPRRQPGLRFNRTLFTHPAIFMVEYALGKVLIAAGVVPGMVLGTSLGTYAAAVFAGSMDAEQALRAMIKTAMQLEALCEYGTMIAVLDEPAVFERLGLQEHAEIAALNLPSHFVIAALVERQARIESILSSAKVVFQTLDVSHAFHSKWIDPAQGGTCARLLGLRMQPPRLPLICCARAGQLQEFDDQCLWDAVRAPVRFGQTLAYLERSAAHIYLDVGPSGTLATFVKYALPKSSPSEAFAILSPFGKDMERLEAVIAQCANGRGLKSHGTTSHRRVR